MSQQFRIVCRGSKLSLAQADIFRKRVAEIDTSIRIEIIIKETVGDVNQTRSLQEIEGKDFFTKDIQDFLLTGQADFAVHSLKDVSGEDFFNNTHFALIDRDDPRDIAIFNSNIIEKIDRGEELVIGTSSPRRVMMATSFLANALPRRVGAVNVKAETIRGNVDTRLQKLHDGGYDGIILACAGLNRLLRSEHAKYVAGLLKDKLLMILPLLDCPPAPGQGAIVAEATPNNSSALEILHSINSRSIAKAVDLERKIAHRYGSGCHQKFGVIHIHDGETNFIHAAGWDRAGNLFSCDFSENGSLVDLDRKATGVDLKDAIFEEQNIQLITDPSTTFQMNKRIWISETEAWFTLAKRGCWVEGSFEGFGVKFNEGTLRSPVMNNRHVV